MVGVGDGEDVVLAPESGEQRAADEGEHADAEGPGGERNFLGEAAHSPDVLFLVEGVDDGAGGQEEQGLEAGVRGEVEHRRVGSAAADGHDHVAELRERRVGDDALDVVLLDGDERGEQRGESADVGDDVQRVCVKQKENPAKHINTGGNHCRSVDQSGHGRRAFHRVRQPNVQRELR